MTKPIEPKTGWRCVCAWCKSDLPHSDLTVALDDKDRVSHGMCNPPCAQAVAMGFGDQEVAQ